MAFGKNINNVVINGQALVKVTPAGGASTDISYVAKVTAEGKHIPYNATRGNITAGYDWTLKWQNIQTRASDWSDAAGNRQLDSVSFIGPNDTLTIPNIFLEADLKKNFDNKADSTIDCEIFVPGVSISTSQGYMVASTTWS